MLRRYVALAFVALLFVAGNGRAEGLRLAKFDVDVTPPVGTRMAYDPVTNTWDLGLRARLGSQGTHCRS